MCSEQNEKEGHIKNLNSDTDGKDVLNRTIKDCVFTNLFSIPKYSSLLYNTFHPQLNPVKENEIKNFAISNILVNGIFNDLSFLVKNTYFFIMEAQTTWSEHILLREILYLMTIYKNYCTEKKYNLYGNKKIILPFPEMYVLYTGTNKNIPDKLDFKNIYFNGKENINHLNFDIPVITKSINDNDILGQYIRFTKESYRFVNEYGKSKEAILEFINFCIKNKILKEYLETKKTEVLSIMMTLFNQEYAMEMYRYEIEEEGKKKGEEIGEKRGKKKGEIANLKKMIKRILKMKFNCCNDEIKERIDKIKDNKLGYSILDDAYASESISDFIRKFDEKFEK